MRHVTRLRSCRPRWPPAPASRRPEGRASECGWVGARRFCSGGGGLKGNRETILWKPGKTQTSIIIGHAYPNSRQLVGVSQEAWMTLFVCMFVLMFSRCLLDPPFKTKRLLTLGANIWTHSSFGKFALCLEELGCKLTKHI